MKDLLKACGLFFILCNYSFASKYIHFDIDPSIAMNFTGGGFHWLDEEPVSSISPVYFDGFIYKKGWGWAGFWMSKVWITDSPSDGSKKESRCINQNDSNLHMNSAPIVSPVAVISNTFESLKRVKFNLSSPKMMGFSQLVVVP